MREYQPFPISNFRTGFDEAVEPWLLPRDAYQTMINAHLYRGILEKIDGYTLYAKMSYRNIMSLGTPNGVTKTFTITLPGGTTPVTTNFFAYGEVVLGTSAETFMYNGDASATVINLIGSLGGTGTVNLSTRVVTITFNTAPPSNTYSAIFFVWDSASPGNKAIMGIKQYFNNNGSQEILVFDQQRVGKIIPITGTLASLAGTNNAISEIQHDYYQSAIFTGNGSTMTFTGTLAGAPFLPGTLSWTEYTSTGAPTGRVITDNGFGTLQGTNVTSAASFVNYVTGQYTITFTVAPTTGNYFDSVTALYGNLFTGSISDFFVLTNYQYKAFFTNNVNRIMYYDGISLHFLNTNTSAPLIVSSSSGVPSYTINRCLHVFTLRERLLLISPTINGILQVSTNQWSVAGNPLDFTNNEFLAASTSQPIRAIGYINTDLIVRFANSERVFRYTNDAFSPFRWDSTNNLWACDAPYSTVNYDSWFSTVGKPAIVGSDGVNVKRIDELIPDFTDPDRLPTQPFAPYMSQTSIQQCYGERFDDTKEGWICYNSVSKADSSVAPSDNVLSFNYLDGTYATYSFPFSCLGFGQIITATTWGTTFTDWDDADIDWGSYADQKNSLVDLAGDQFDKVYQLDSGNSLGDGVTPVLMNVISKNFNPFVEDGQLCRLGYIDLLVTADQDTTMRVQFFVNDELYIDANNEPAGFYQDSMITFTPTDAMSSRTQAKVWKRIYVGAVGKFHTIRFYQKASDFEETLDQPIFIHAMVLYMKPAGRIFN